MTVEGLHRQTSAHVPDRDSLVCCTTHKEVSEGLEVEAIDCVCVLAVLLSHLEGMQVKKLYGTFSSS